MKKVTLLGVMAGVCLYFNCTAQNHIIDIRTTDEPLFISSWIKKDTLFGKIINNTPGAPNVLHLKDKLTIIAFWFTSCTSCIKEFPKEIALQKKYSDDLQIIMVTKESEETVTNFLKKWEAQNNLKFNMPVIVEDTLFHRAIRQLYNPHYAWLLPGGRLTAQTSQEFVNEACIQQMIEEGKKLKKELPKRFATKN